MAARHREHLRPWIGKLLQSGQRSRRVQAAHAARTMDTTQRIRSHFADSAQLKLAAAEALAPEIARAAALMTECLLGDG